MTRPRIPGTVFGAKERGGASGQTRRLLRRRRYVFEISHADPADRSAGGVHAGTQPERARLSRQTIHFQHVRAAVGQPRLLDVVADRLLLSDVHPDARVGRVVGIAHHDRFVLREWAWEAVFDAPAPKARQLEAL